MTSRSAWQPRVVAVGLCTVDLVQRVRRLPEPGEKVVSAAVELAAGGPAANAAVAVAALGGAARLVTAIGAHPLAELARNDLATCGVAVTDATPDRADPPPVSAVAVRDSDGERTVVSRNAADILATPGAGMSTPADAGQLDADVVLVDGHHPLLALHAASTARAAGIPVLLDAGSWKPVLTELLPLVDVCACSSGFLFPEHPDPAGTEVALHAAGVPVVTRTDGARPVRWSVRRAGSWRDRGIERGTVPVPATPARDTSAAGDVWHGALALGIARLGAVPSAADLPPLLAAANAAAALRVRHAGARAWVAALRGGAR